jgi:hypothetical protein
LADTTVETNSFRRYHLFPSSQSLVTVKMNRPLLHSASRKERKYEAKAVSSY